MLGQRNTFLQDKRLTFNLMGMDLKDRIKEARKHASLTQNELAERVGIKQASISELERGLSRTSGHLIAIARICGVNPMWLADGTGEMIQPLSAAITKTDLEGLTLSDVDSSFPRIPSENEFVVIPQLSVVGECGNGHLNGHVEVEGGMAFRKDWLTKLSVKPEHCRALYAEGASMEPYIFEDDIVLVDTSDKLPKDRIPYAIRRADGGISFKRLIRQLSGTWLLRSDNPDKAMYPDEEVSATAMHDIPIIGRIIWRGGQM